jgi:urease accessory protein
VTQTTFRNTRAALGAAAAALALLAATPALAHTGIDHVHSMASGFAHPFTGLDHLFAMVAVGLWAGINGGRVVWAWPLAFVALMIVGAAVGAAHIAIPFVETGILASVIVLGIAVTASLRAPALLGAIVIGAFALLHGHAHGAELPAGASVAGYMTGFVLATALLHSIGATAAVYAGQGTGRVAIRAVGAVVAVAGLALALN